MKVFDSKQVADTQKLAQRLAVAIEPGCLILLNGPLGSGKTAFTQALGHSLGIKRGIKSPTYTIVKEYEGLDKIDKLIHMDAYRLETGGADTIDIDHFLQEDSVCVIEWPEFVLDYLPSDYIRIDFEHINDHSRRLYLSLAPNASAKHQRVFEEWTAEKEGVMTDDA